MTREEFDALVGRLERQARHDPAGYQARALALALLGNAYLGLVLLLIAAVLAGLVAMLAVLKAVAVKLILVGGAFLLMVLRAAWIRIPAPQGMSVNQSDAPELFALIESLQRAHRAPPAHHVLVIDEFNAAVVQAPRLGIFGGYRNYLLLGLPLMNSLTVEQFRAVLAHEFGHLAKGHARIGNWIYCQRLRWARVASVLEEAESPGRFLFAPLFKWYVPYFSAYSFPLARANEYEADAASARLTSPQAAAEALTGVEVLDRYLHERFWPCVHRQADDVPRPVLMPYATLGQRLAIDVDEPSASRWLQESMARRTDTADTHPALADRLQAIGEGPRLAPPAAGEGADRLLGRALTRIVEQFDSRWEDEILPSWQSRHREVQQRRRRFAALEQQARSGPELSVQDAYERALLTESVGSDGGAMIEQLQRLLERDPDHVGACFALGARLLDRDDDAGIELVERGLRREPGTLVHAAALLRDHATRRGRESEASHWHERWAAEAGRLQALEQERTTIRLDDELHGHGLPDAALGALRRQLQAIPGLRRAYLVRKLAPAAGNMPLYVLAYKIGGAFRLHGERRASEILEQIQRKVTYPEQTVFVNLDGANRRFAMKFFWLRGARIL